MKRLIFFAVFFIILISNQPVNIIHHANGSSEIINSSSNISAQNQSDSSQNHTNKSQPIRVYQVDPLDNMTGNIHANLEFGEPSSNPEGKDSAVDSMLSRWHNEMGSFTDAEFFTIEIKAKETKTIFIKVTGSPSTIKGGVLISSKGLVNFKLNVMSPSDGKVFSSENHREDLFKIIVSELGMYRVLLTNNNYFSKMDVWVITDVEQPVPLINNLIANDDLYQTESKLDIMDKNINDLIAEQRFFDARQRKFREDVSYVNWKSVIISIFASVIVVLLTGWQLCYIKSVVESKKSSSFGF